MNVNADIEKSSFYLEQTIIENVGHSRRRIRLIEDNAKYLRLKNYPERDFAEAVYLFLCWGEQFCRL